MHELMIKTATPGVFLEAVSRHPKRVALREKHLGVWSEVTWEDYRRHVEDFALGLIALGVERGDKVCIHSEGVQEWFYADMAVQAVGGVSVGVYPTNPSAEVQYIANHCDAVVYIAQDQEQTDKVLQVKDQLPCLKKVITMDIRGLRHYQEPMLMSFKAVEELGRILKLKQPQLFLKRIEEVRLDDEALIIYTSGTTGPPKGAVHTHRSFLTGAKALVNFLKLGPKDHFLSYLPLCHAAERLFSVYMPLFCDAVVNLAESTQTVQRDLKEIAPTFFVAMPRILEKMMATVKVKTDESTCLKKHLSRWLTAWGYAIAEKKLSNQALSLGCKMKCVVAHWVLFRKLQDHLGLINARVALCGGAAVSSEVLKYFHAIGVPFRQVYGQTEGLIIFSHEENDIQLDSVGKRPLPGVEVKLMESGELCWRWEGNFKGYYKESKLTASTVDDEGWLHSGDVATFDDRGHLKIIDRVKNIIITSGGKNITPEFIENKIKASPYISDAIVIGEARPYLTALIQVNVEVVGKWAEDKRIAFTTLKDLSANPQVKELVAEIVSGVNKQISQVEQIKKFSLIGVELDHESGELTATMKIKRKIVEKKFTEEIKSLYRKAK